MASKSSEAEFTFKLMADNILQKYTSLLMLREEIVKSLLPDLELQPESKTVLLTIKASDLARLGIEGAVTMFPDSRHIDHINKFLAEMRINYSGYSFVLQLQPESGTQPLTQQFNVETTRHLEQLREELRLVILKGVQHGNYQVLSEGTHPALGELNRLELRTRNFNRSEAADHLLVAAQGLINRVMTIPAPVNTGWALLSMVIPTWSIPVLPNREIKIIAISAVTRQENASTRNVLRIDFVFLNAEQDITSDVPGR